MVLFSNLRSSFSSPLCQPRSVLVQLHPGDLQSWPKNGILAGEQSLGRGGCDYSQLNGGMMFGGLLKKSFCEHVLIK